MRSPNGMRQVILAAFLCALCSVASAQDIVLFGDSLSDNGNGYAATAKFVLRTDQVASLTPSQQPSVLLLALVKRFYSTY